jgi:hypothetical protein
MKKLLLVLFVMVLGLNAMTQTKKEIKQCNKNRALVSMYAQKRMWSDASEYFIKAYNLGGLSGLEKADWNNARIIYTNLIEYERDTIILSELTDTLLWVFENGSTYGEDLVWNEKWEDFKNGCLYWKNDVDEFTGDIKKYTISKNIGYNDISENLTFELRKVNSSRYIFGKYTGDLGCISYDSYIMIKLQNGDIIKMIHIGNVDCGSNSPMYFKINDSDYEKLLNSPMASIRISGTEFYTDIKTITFPNYFINELNCIK